MTGGAAGIGRASAVRLAADGVAVAVADVSMSLDNVLAVAGAAREHPGRHTERVRGRRSVVTCQAGAPIESPPVGRTNKTAGTSGGVEPLPL